MRVPELLQKRAQIADQIKAALDKVSAEGRTCVTPDEQTALDRMEADINGLNDLIERERRSELTQAQLGNTLAGQQTQVETTRDERTARDQAQRQQDAAVSWIRRGFGGLTEEFRGLLPRGDYGGGDSILFRDLSAVTGSTGGYTVPQGFYYTLTEALKWYGGIRSSRATILRTATGNDLPMPTENDTTNVGELLAESAAAGTADPTFGQVVMKAYKFSSKVVKVPIELIQDSAFDISSYVARKLGIRIGRITNTYMTTGTGLSQPQGIVNGSTLGKTTASPTAITYGELKDLEHSVDPAYRGGAEFMFHDLIASYLEKLVDGNSRPILVSSLQGLTGGAVEAGSVNRKVYLMGYPTVINQDMDSTVAATKKTALFGDLSTFHVREVMDLMLVRFAELYMANGQVGFLAFYRADSKALDAGTHPVSYLQQHA